MTEKVLLILSYVIPYMSEETVTIPKRILLKLAENNKIISDKLEKISEMLKPKNRRAFFSFFVVC